MMAVRIAWCCAELTSGEQTWVIGYLR
jgi:hypothetical protein